MAGTLERIFIESYKDKISKKSAKDLFNMSSTESTLNKKPRRIVMTIGEKILNLFWINRKLSLVF